jgi:succinyl-diaminopimelate desuccinylase
VAAASGPSSGRIGFLITSDEGGTGGTDGTVQGHAVNCRSAATHIDWCVVGEPSSSEQAGRHGQERAARLAERPSSPCAGKQGHVAYPQHADNPIHRALPALNALIAEHWDSGNDYFPPTSFQISNIQGGTGATNVIPGELTLLLQLPLHHRGHRRRAARAHGGRFILPARPRPGLPRSTGSSAASPS